MEELSLFLASIRAVFMSTVHLVLVLGCSAFVCPSSVEEIVWARMFLCTLVSRTNNKIVVKRII